MVLNIPKKRVSQNRVVLFKQKQKNKDDVDLVLQQKQDKYEQIKFNIEQLSVLVDMETGEVNNLRELVTEIRDHYNDFMMQVMKRARDIRNKGLVWILFKLQSNNQKPDVKYLQIDQNYRDMLYSLFKEQQNIIDLEIIRDLGVARLVNRIKNTNKVNI